MTDAVVTKQKDMSEPMLGALLLLPAALLLLGLMLLGQISAFTAFIQDMLSSITGTL